jgi:hypothetical protein
VHHVPAGGVALGRAPADPLRDAGGTLAHHVTDGTLEARVGVRLRRGLIVRVGVGDGEPARGRRGEQVGECGMPARAEFHHLRIGLQAELFCCCRA